ncbi:MAG TPA: YceI family protein [Candidatus Acidoferrum sp.]
MNKSLRRLSILTAGTLLSCLPGVAATSTWKLDPRHSAAQFSVKHMGISTVRGAFSKVDGTVEYDEQDVSKSTVNVSIDVSTVDTREPARDKDLRSDHFFDVEHFPAMTFKSTKVEQVAPGKLKVTGDLTIRGTTKQAVLDVEGPSAPIKDSWGNQRSAINATTRINRQDFGVKWNATLDNGGVVVSDDVNINIDAEMTKQAAK